MESVAAGIEDRDRSNGSTLLANVNPTFNWVRLAQRVPVRIALDRAERNELVAGATATVEVLNRYSRQPIGSESPRSRSQRLARALGLTLVQLTQQSSALMALP